MHELLLGKCWIVRRKAGRADLTPETRTAGHPLGVTKWRLGSNSGHEKAGEPFGLTGLSSNG